MMPVMDGHQASRTIRASDHPEAKTIPIIAMTANAYDEDVKAALDAGMNAHVAKPIDLDRLYSVLYYYRRQRAGGVGG
jgi:CheY-like chemotaxis protein